MSALKSKRLARRFWSLFGAVALAGLFTVGAWFTYVSATLVTRGEKTMATCTKVTQRRNSEGRRRSTFHVSYTTADGMPRTGSVSPGFEGLREGQQIEVLYDPQHPERVQANRFWSLWGLPAMFGGVVLMAAVSALLRMVRGGRSAAEDNAPREHLGGAPVDTTNFGPIERDATSLQTRLASGRPAAKRTIGAQSVLIGIGVLVAALAASWAYDQWAPGAAPGPRRASTLTTILTWCVAWGTIPVVAMWVLARMNQRRRETIEQVAQELGWRTATSELPEGTPAFPLFTDHPGGHFEHVLLSPDADDPLLAVYEWTERSDNHHVTRRELCAIYPFAAAGLPDMVIRPEMLEDKIAAWVNGADINFDESPLLTEFSKKYQVRSQEEARVREIVDEPLARSLLDHLGWTIETKDGSVLARWKRMQSFRRARHSLRDAAAVRKFLEESRVVAHAVREAAAGGMPSSS